MYIALNQRYVFVFAQVLTTRSRTTDVMKKQRKAFSYADTPESAITHWWGTHADRTDADDSTQLLMTLGAMGSISDLMSDVETSAVLPHFISMRTPGLLKVAYNTLDNAFTEMFADRDLAMPTRTGVQRITSNAKRHGITRIAYTFGEVCEMLWDLVAKHIDIKMVLLLPRAAHKALLPAADFRRSTHYTHRRWPNSEEAFSCTAKALASAIPVQAAGQLVPGSIDTVMDMICNETFMATGIDVDRGLLKDHIAPICMELEPTPFLAKTLLRTRILQEVIGDALCQRVRSYCFRSDWQIDAPSLTSDESLHHAVAQELMNARKTLNDVRVHLANGHAQRARDASGVPRVVTAEECKIARRTSKSAATHRTVHDATVAAVTANVSLTHVGAVFNLVEAKYNITLSSSRVSRQVKSYAIILNDAVELTIKDDIAKVFIVFFSHWVHIFDIIQGMISHAICPTINIPGSIVKVFVESWSSEQMGVAAINVSTCISTH